jgi:hypothetical protein
MFRARRPLAPQFRRHILDRGLERCVSVAALQELHQVSAQLGIM